MNTRSPASRKSLNIIRLAILTVKLLAGADTLAYRLIGNSLGIRSRLAPLKDIAFGVVNSRNASGFHQEQDADIIFLHHSVGHNLSEEGNVRKLFTEADYSFFDHDYNNPGLTGSYGEAQGYSYNIPNDNTDVDDLARIFQQTVFPLPLNTLSGLL